MVWRMGKNASMPCWLQRVASLVVQPEKARTVLLYFLAMAATPDGGFAHDGLAIEATFTGDDDAGVLDVGFQPGFFEDDLDAGLEGGVCVREKGEAKSSGGSGAGVAGVSVRVCFPGDAGVEGKPLSIWRSCPGLRLFADRDGTASLWIRRVGSLHRGIIKVTTLVPGERVCHGLLQSVTDRWLRREPAVCFCPEYRIRVPEAYRCRRRLWHFLRCRR